MSSYVNANVMHPEPSSVGYDREKLWRHRESVRRVGKEIVYLISPP